VSDLPNTVAAMGTTRLDVTDEERCRQAFDAFVASKGLDRPWFEPPSFDEMIVDWRHEDAAEPKEIWVVEDDRLDGKVAGFAIMWLPMQDNTWLSWFDIQVHPDARRRGHGSALIERVLERAREHGRTELVTDLLAPQDQPEHPYRRFIEGQGFSLSNTEIIRHLDLPVADTLLDRLEAESRPRWEGDYRLETHVGGVPEHLRASLCAVMNQLAVDAPTGAIEFEPETLDPARYQEQLDVEREQKRVRLTTVAIDEKSGDVVAYTDLVLPAGAPSVVWQWGTLVHGDHRGHRLGMAVKIENLRRLQADHPTRKRVMTGNDGTNSYMVSINEELGFRIVELCPAYHRKL
jgi:GNAT superfamily N-acetyltransferase